MPLKISAGNMYPWVTHTITHIGGECPHRCTYCSVDNPRFGRAPRYTGEVRLIEEEMKVCYDEKTLRRHEGVYPGTIFIEHMNDLFEESIPEEFIMRILARCSEFPINTYVLQSKNPSRMLQFQKHFPPSVILGTTIETNRPTPEISHAPCPEERYGDMMDIRSLSPEIRIFITIEPILAFDLDVLASWILEIRPDFLNIGADSKNHHLHEPTKAEVLALVAKLREGGIEVREKHNLDRLIA